MIRRLIVCIAILFVGLRSGVDYQREVYARIVEELSEVYKVSPKALDVYIVRYPRIDGKLFSMDWDVEYGGERVRLGYNTVWLTFRDRSGGIVKRLPVNVRVSGYFDVVVAKEKIEGGAIVSRQKLDVRRVKVSRGELNFFRAKDMACVVGTVSRRLIRDGEILRPHMVKEKPILRRGQRVKVKIVSNGVELTTYGRLKEDGYVGKDVRVICEPADRILKGEVRDSSIVVVKLN